MIKKVVYFTLILNKKLLYLLTDRFVKKGWRLALRGFVWMIGIVNMKKQFTNFGVNAVDDSTRRVEKLFGKNEINELIEFAKRLAA